MENWSALDEKDPVRKFKGLYLPQGNRVKGEHSETALLNELGGSPASM